MKKVIVIVGSARKGNSLQIGSFTKETIDVLGSAETEMICLADYKIDYCDGCLSCDSTGVCHKDDNVSGLLEKVKIADGVVFVSPTRWSLLSGDVKVFMDRWNPLAGKGIFSNKKSLVVTVGQTNKEESVSTGKAIESLKFFSDDAGFEFKGAFTFENCLNANDVSSQTEAFNEYKKLICQFAKSL
ncbi:MAG: flavodoxin family protein [Treponema sp.]|nr:flavodoxin family protein [Treponema sp.]